MRAAPRYPLREPWIPAGLPHSGPWRVGLASPRRPGAETPNRPVGDRFSRAGLAAAGRCCRTRGFGPRQKKCGNREVSPARCPAGGSAADMGPGAWLWPSRGHDTGFCPPNWRNCRGFGPRELPCPGPDSRGFGPRKPVPARVLSGFWPLATLISAVRGCVWGSYPHSALRAGVVAAGAALSGFRPPAQGWCPEAAYGSKGCAGCAIRRRAVPPGCRTVRVSCRAGASCHAVPSCRIGARPLPAPSCLGDQGLMPASLPSWRRSARPLPYRGFAPFAVVVARGLRGAAGFFGASAPALVVLRPVLRGLRAGFAAA